MRNARKKKKEMVGEKKVLFFLFLGECKRLECGFFSSFLVYQRLLDCFLRPIKV